MRLAVLTAIAWALPGAPVPFFERRPSAKRGGVGSVCEMRAGAPVRTERPKAAKLATLDAALGGKCKADVRSE